MPFKTLTPSLSASPQLTQADVAQAALQGFRAIIDNRPDGEEPGQLSATDMQALAVTHGMGFAHCTTTNPAGRWLVAAFSTSRIPAVQKHG